MNLKRFLSFMTRGLMAAVVLMTLGLSGCDDDDDGPTVYSGTTLQFLLDPKNQEETTGDPNTGLDSLAKYLQLHPELTTLLSGSTEVTLFAPSNQAFINLLATPNFPQDISLISPNVIKSVLLYHIVEGKLLKDDLEAGATLNSKFTDPLSPSAPQVITVNANGTLMGASNAANVDIDIVKDDLQTQNGVVHIVESVMIPPSTGAVLVPILGTVAGAVLLGKDFTNLASVILAADAAFAENVATMQLDVSQWLALPITSNPNGITFFAPPNAIGANAVFSETLAASLIASPDKGRGFLLNHLVVGTNELAELTDNKTMVPVSGKTIIVKKIGASPQNPLDILLSNVIPPTAATLKPVVKGDIAYSNGVLHVFAGALN